MNIHTLPYFNSLLTMAQKRLKQVILRALAFSGQNPLVYNTFSKISTWLILICTSILCPLILIKMCREFDDIDVLVPTFESLMSLYQVNILKQTKILYRLIRILVICKGIGYLYAEKKTSCTSSKHGKPFLGT